jgi:hypothetical protein
MKLQKYSNMHIDRRKGYVSLPAGYILSTEEVRLYSVFPASVLKESFKKN